MTFNMNIYIISYLCNIIKNNNNNTFLCSDKRLINESKETFLSSILLYTTISKPICTDHERAKRNYVSRIRRAIARKKLSVNSRWHAVKMCHLASCSTTKRVEQSIGKKIVIKANIRPSRSSDREFIGRKNSAGGVTDLDFFGNEHLDRIANSLEFVYLFFPNF